MSLGQTLIVIMALVLFTTVAISINRLKASATIRTIDSTTDLDAIDYGSSIMEAISKAASTASGYNNLQNQVLSPLTTGSGRVLFASVAVADSGLTIHDIDYKQVIVSVYSDSTMTSNYLLSEYYASFTDWWND